MDPALLFQEYGPRFFPCVVFGCAVLENDVTFLMAGIYASSVHPHLSPWVAIAAGVLGALCHDTFWFLLARNRSSYIRRTSGWKRVGPQIESWAARFGTRELFFARFLPGTRLPSVFFWGLQRLPFHLFYLLEASALLLWGTLLTWLGFRFGQQTEVLLGHLKHKHLGKYLLIALVLSLAGYFLIRAFTRHEIVKHGQPPADPRAD